MRLYREIRLLPGQADAAAGLRALAEASPNRIASGRAMRPDGHRSAHLALALHEDGSEVLTITLLGAHPMSGRNSRRWALAFWGERWTEASWSQRGSVRVLTLGPTEQADGRQMP